MKWRYLLWSNREYFRIYGIEITLFESPDLCRRMHTLAEYRASWRSSRIIYYGFHIFRLVWTPKELIPALSERAIMLLPKSRTALSLTVSCPMRPGMFFRKSLEAQRWMTVDSFSNVKLVILIHDLQLGLGYLPSVCWTLHTRHMLKSWADRPPS